MTTDLLHVGDKVICRNPDSWLRDSHKVVAGVTVGIITRLSALSADDDGVLVNWGTGGEVRSDRDELALAAAAPSDTDLREAARAEAGRRYAAYPAQSGPFLTSGFEAGAEWLFSRTPQPSTEVWDELRESLDQELELGGDGSTLVAAVREWMQRTCLTPAQPERVTTVEPVICDSVFGAYYDFGFHNARTIVVGTRVNGNFQPHRIMLPHQLYVRDVAAMVAAGATEVRAHPIYSEGFNRNWVEVPLPAVVSPEGGDPR